jgi:hypothetical protein
MEQPEEATPILSAMAILRQLGLVKRLRQLRGFRGNRLLGAVRESYRCFAGHA